MKKGPRRALEAEGGYGKGGAAGDSPAAPPRPTPLIRVERRPPVSGALLSHGLTPQYHRRSAA